MFVCGRARLSARLLWARDRCGGRGQCSRRPSRKRLSRAAEGACARAARLLSMVGHVRVNYLLHAPAGYANRTRRSPLVVFLHGNGGRGTDAESSRSTRYPRSSPLRRVSGRRLVPSAATSLRLVVGVDPAGRRTCAAIRSPLPDRSGACLPDRAQSWRFHGADDTTVYPYQSEVLVRALRRCGSRVVRFTPYPGVDHVGTWPRAYRDPALWKWLFAQRLS